MAAQGTTVNAAFNALDTNHDGVISRQEFAAAASGGSNQAGVSVNFGDSVNMVGATTPGTIMVGAGAAPSTQTYCTSPAVTYGAPGQAFAGTSIMGGHALMQGQITGGTMIGGENMVPGMPGMQLVAEPIATGMQMPMAMSEPVPTQTPSPVRTMPIPVASDVPGAIISNMPVFAPPAMEAKRNDEGARMYMDQTVAPTVYAAPQVGQYTMSTAAGPVDAELNQASVITYSAPDVTAAPITYAGPPTTVVAPPVYMQQPVNTTVSSPTATSMTHVAPAIEIREKIVEVPQVEVREVEKHVRVPQIQKIIKEVPRIETQTVEKVVEIPQVELRERIVEVPEIQVCEIIKPVARVRVQEVVKEVKRPEVQTIVREVEVPQLQTVERFIEVPEVQIQEVIKEKHVVQIQEKLVEVPKIVEVPVPQVVSQMQPVQSMMQSSMMQSAMMQSSMMQSSMMQSQGMTVGMEQTPPTTTFTTMAPQMSMQAPTVTATARPSMQYSMAQRTTMVAEPAATRVEPAGMVMEQQPVPTRIEGMSAVTYGAPPSMTSIAGAQPGVVVGGTAVVGAAVQQEGFLQHAMRTVGGAMGLGGSQATTTDVQGGGVTIASDAAGWVTSFDSMQAAAPVTYGSTGATGAASAANYDATHEYSAPQPMTAQLPIIAALPVYSAPQIVEAPVAQVQPVQSMMQPSMMQPMEYSAPQPMTTQAPTMMQPMEYSAPQPMTTQAPMMAALPVYSAPQVAPAIQIQGTAAEAPVPLIQEVIKEVPRIEIQHVEKTVEVPHFLYEEQIVEVPQVQTHEVVRHVAKKEIREVLKEVKKVQVQNVEKEVAIPQVQYVERIVEKPEVEIREIIAHVPRVHVQEVVKHVKRTKVQTVEKIVEVPQVQIVERTVEKIIEVPQAQAPTYGAPQPITTSSQAMAPPVYMTSPAQMTSGMMVQGQLAMEMVPQAQAPTYGAPQPIMTSSQAMAPPVYMTSPAQMTSGMMVQGQPAMEMAMTAPQAATMSMEQMLPTTFTTMAPQTAIHAPAVNVTRQHSMPQTMAGAAMVGTALVAEPVATRIEPAGSMMEETPLQMRTEGMSAANYGAPPSMTSIAGVQPGVVVGSTAMVGAAMQQEGFLQHAMRTVGGALGLGGSQGTHVQGSAFDSVQATAPVTYGAPGTVATVSTGGYVVGGAGSASLFDQIDTNKDGVISRAEFAQAVQQ